MKQQPIMYLPKGKAIADIYPMMLVCRNKNCKLHSDGSEGKFIWERKNQGVIENDLFYCSVKCENEDKIRKELEEICQEVSKKTLAHSGMET